MIAADGALQEQARALKDELLGKLFGDAVEALGALPARHAVHARGRSWTPIMPPEGAAIVGGGLRGQARGRGHHRGHRRAGVRPHTKLPRAALAEREAVPGIVAGFTTDVIAIGDLVAHRRPVRCGVSIGHPDVTAGTLGCLLSHGDDRFLLSNNHVLADVNRASPGDAILQPGLIDGGDLRDPIAELADFEPIDFDEPNLMDAAIARLYRAGDALPEIEIIGRVADPPVVASLYQSLRKYGRTTRHTVGVVTGLSEDMYVRFDRRRAAFVDQLAVVGVGGAFSENGDSGALAVDSVTRRPVGLLFAGGRGHSFLNPIGPVLARFPGKLNRLREP